MKSFIAIALVTIASVEFALNEAASTVVKWNKRHGDFVTIVEEPSEEIERKKQILQSRRRETHNFDGQSLHILYYEDPGFFQTDGNDTKIFGITADLWTTLSNLLNFTLEVTFVEGGSLGMTFKNGTYGGILENARLNETDVIPQMSVYITRYRAVDFSPVYWMTSQRIFACGQWKRNRLWMFKLFTTEVWFLIFVFIVMLGLVSRVTQKVLIRHRGRKLQSESYFSHLFYTYSTMCNQGNATDNTGSGSRILSYTISIFSWLTLIVYSSRLIYSMGQETFNAPFDDLDSLLEKTNFQILVVKGSPAAITFASPYAMPIFDRIKTANRLTVLSNLEEVHRQVCLNSSKYVMFDSEDAVAARGTVVCRLFPVGEAYYITPIAAGISRRVENKKSLDIGIMKLHEHGLIDAIIKRYVAPEGRVTGIRHPESLAIDMDRVYFIFAIFCLGIVASVVICAAENIVFALKNRNDIENFVRRFPAIKKIISPYYKRARKFTKD